MMYTSVISGISRKMLGFCCIAVFVIISVYYYETAHVTIQLKLSPGSPVSRSSYPSPDTKGKKAHIDEKGHEMKWKKLRPGPSVSTTSFRTRDTKGNKTTTDEKGHGMIRKNALSSSIVLYNRVPKCGSISMKRLIKSMSSQNRFHALQSQTFLKWRIPHNEQEAFVNKVSKLPTPVVYDRHVHYVNFTRFGVAKPVHINIIRDPIERLTSEYYYAHKLRKLGKYSKLKYSEFTTTARHYADIANASPNQSYDECLMKQRPGCNRTTDVFIIVPFFCGQEDFCLEPSADSLARAKHNVINNYLLVGILEEIGSFIKGLEILLPQFFKGAGSRKLYHANSTKKKPLKNETVDLLRTKLREEYDFYHFVKQKFYKAMTYLKMND